VEEGEKLMHAASETVAVSAPARSGGALKLARGALTFACWMVAGFALCLTAVVALPGVVGYRSLTVVSGSMEPTLETGSVVIDDVIRPLDARPGDILTFNDPQRKRLLTHRLRRMRVEGGTAHMVTRGDANDAPERWSVPVNGEIGRVAFHVPKLGHARAFISRREVRLGLLGAVFLVGALFLVDVWRPKREAAS
jgi:signal peptidase I